MSRTVGDDLKAHLAGEVSTLVTCWRIERQDSQEFFFTSHDVDLVIDGDTYLAATGVLPSALSQTRKLAVDNLQAMTFLDSETITEGDIVGGLFDGAVLDIFVVNWSDLSQGKMYLVKDWTLGEMKINDNTFEAECRGKCEHYQRQIVDLYSPVCRATLGDSRCGSPFRNSRISVVETVISRSTFSDTTLPDVPDADDYFTWGSLTWDNGANIGITVEIRSFTPATGVIELFEDMPSDISVGDGYTMMDGCDKTAATCKSVFDNIVNFRGEPFVPGMDRALHVGPPDEAPWQGHRSAAGDQGHLTPVPK